MQISLSRQLIVKNITTLISNSAISQGITALAFLLTARQLGASEFGQYAATMALAGILSVGFNLGLDIWLLREGGREPSKIAQSVGSVTFIKFIGGLIWLGIIILLSFTLLKSLFPPLLMVLSAIAVWLDSILMTSLTAFKTSLQNTQTLIIESSSDMFWLLGTLLLIALGIDQAATFVLMRIVILILSVIISVLWVKHLIGLQLSIDTVKRSIRSSPPYAFSEFLAIASLRIDIIIVTVALGTFYVGIYSPAVSIVNAFFLIPASVYMVMVPVISNQFSSDVDQAWRTASRFNLILLLIGAASAIALYFGSWLLVPILGASYEQSSDILRILSFILVFKSISFGMAAILIAIGHQSQRTIIQAVAVSLNIILNLLVINTFGINGVAVVYLLTETILLIGYFGLVQYYKKKQLFINTT